MKKITCALMLVLLLVSFQMNTVESAASDCLDACQTGCAVSYIRDPKRMSRCDRKCTIKCKPGRNSLNP
ncbi:hypothetical protein GIB67_000788 [Kingdonia uniflora]|uniref:Thionin-like protein n=1 Tax=Kingdonia uniflora TaxID=39325 RepID=A0A7J7MR69_9MAGN|nr:hypothetical protein GIB67_029891 [Kingdonia uniflora]KAF6172730.1 hypothetical protein GIB67_000788 [Kingdonia uniflora]